MLLMLPGKVGDAHSAIGVLCAFPQTLGTLSVPLLPDRRNLRQFAKIQIE